MKVNNKRAKYEKEGIITACCLSGSVLPTGVGRHDIRRSFKRFKEEFLKLLFRCEQVLSLKLWDLKWGMWEQVILSLQASMQIFL